MPDELVSTVMNRLEENKTSRRVFDGHWQDVKELVRCDTMDFNRKQVPGYRRYDMVYDGTAIDANEEFGCGIHSYLTNPVERWFELEVQDSPEVMMDPDVLLWLDFVSDLIYSTYAQPRVNLNPTLHEGYLDLGAFGNCNILQEWDSDEGHLVFTSFPLAECYYNENNCGRVDTHWRSFEWSGRKIREEFPDLPEKLSRVLNEGKADSREFGIVHYVGPRDDLSPAIQAVTRKEFVSIWISVSTQEVLRTGGYDSFPWHCPRWLKISGEGYGRGPAMKCLPDIKSLQSMERTMLRAGQKAVDPPLIVPNDGFLLPIKTSPGSLIFRDSGRPEDTIQPLEFKGNVQFGLEQTEQKRQYIRKCFYADWFKRQRKTEQQTATEIVDERDEMLRFLSPMLGRQQTELLGPMIGRTYMLLSQRGMIPPAPPLLQGKKMKIGYTSPAARAQQGVKADKMARYMQDLVPLAQIDPSIFDSIDMDKLSQQYALIRGVPRIILRSPQEMAQMRQQRQQQQAAQQMAQTAEPASKSILNIAQAAKAGGGGGMP